MQNYVKISHISLASYLYFTNSKTPTKYIRNTENFMQTGASRFHVPGNYYAALGQGQWDRKCKTRFTRISSSKVDRFTLNQDQNDHGSILHICRIHFTSGNESSLWHLSVYQSVTCLTYLSFTQYWNVVESLYFSAKLPLTLVNGGVRLRSKDQRSC